MSKCQLNEYCQKSYFGTPQYDTVMRGVGFVSTVTVNGESYVSLEGHGRKKDAETDAATVALQDLVHPTPTLKNVGLTPFGLPPHPILLGGKPNSIPGLLPYGGRSKLLQKGSVPPTQQGVMLGYSLLPTSQPEPAVHIALSPSPPPFTQAPDGHRHWEQVELNFDEELERYCQVRGLASPIFNINENKGRFCGAVIVNGVEYVGCSDQSSFLFAKKTASLVALASIGIHALRCQEQVAGPPSGRRSRGECQSAATEEVQSLWDPCQQQHSGSESPSSSASADGEATLTESLARLKLPADTSPPSAQGVASSTLQLQQTPVFPSDNSTRVSFPFASKTPSRGLALQMANYKSALNYYCQNNEFKPPHYECSFPEDAVGYIATVLVNGQKFSSHDAEGTKRAAESMAACLALDSFGESVGGEIRNVSSRESTVKNGQLEPASSIPATERNVSYKNLLQEHFQKSNMSELPQYTTEHTEDGFVSTVVVKISPEKSRRYEGQPHGNKKAAEQESARVACYELKLVT